jgi:uroporphyrinogen-III decarboxylase
MFTKPENWNQLSAKEKRKLRLDHWEKSEGLQFISPEAEAKYRERIHRLRMAYDLATPDRIIADISMGASEYAIRRKGLTGHHLLYNHESLLDPIVEFNNEFQPDVAVSAFPYPGKLFDMLDLKTYVWGGQKLPDHQVIQAVEGEYMMPEEYADFIADPTAFWMKTYIPRMFGALGAMSMMPDFPRISEIVDVLTLAMPFGMPPVQEMLHRLMDAGNEAMKLMPILGQIGGTLAASGFPSMGYTFVKAPFDFLSDTLRGTRGIMTDLYRRPNDVLAACEAYVPVLVRTITQTCDQMGIPVALYPLHKGADGFMSQEQFAKFYWPTFKAVMLGLFEEGITNYLFVEGTYDSRLEIIAEMPKYSALWHFDKTDMRKVRDILSDKFTIAGNVAASLMSTGSTDDVRAYCDELVELYDGAPGYIMAFGCGFEMTTDEKIRAFQDSVKK